MKKIIYIICVFILLVFVSCTSADLYRVNYPDDPQMQERMERDYGNKPLWK